MRCLECGSEAVTERSERTAQGYRRFRCRTCGKQFNERSDTLLNRAQYPSDVIALVVLWRVRYKLSPRDLPEMFAVRGIVFSCGPPCRVGAGAGLWRRRISRCTGAGVISVAPSTGTGPWSTCCSASTGTGLPPRRSFVPPRR